MRLAGYIKAYKEFMFTIPIYTNGKELFFHEVDSNYKIRKFNKTEVSEDLIQIKNDISFKEKSYGAIVFVGEKNDLITEEFEESIKKISNYLEHKTQKNQFLSVKEDVSYFESLIPKVRKSHFYRVKQNELRFTYNDVRYILEFLNQNTHHSAAYTYKDLITSVYEKVVNSVNKEKAIVECKNEIVQISTPVITVINRNFNPNKRIKLNKLARKRPAPKKQNLKRGDIGAKIIFIKNIIEKVEGKQGTNPKINVK